MRMKRIFVAIVGIVQGVIGTGVMVLVCILYLDYSQLEQTLNILTILKVPEELVPFHISLLVLGVFGFFFIISGLFLVQESLELRFEATSS